jgi:hypothetical protein
MQSGFWSRVYVWSDGDIFVLANGARACGPPSRCPAGHQLRPGRMLVGNVPLLDSLANAYGTVNAEWRNGNGAG